MAADRHVLAAEARGVAPDPVRHARLDGARPADLATDPRGAAGRATSPATVLGLQRVAGNAAVATLVRRAFEVQRKGKAPGAAPPWSQSKRPVVKLGDGPMPAVAMLQQGLNAAVAGGKPLRVTGVFDTDTEAKVKAFQTANPPMPVHGIADKRTWWFLDKAAPRVTRQGSITVLGPDKGEALGTPDLGTTHPTIKLGSKGPAVEELQQKLNTVPVKDVTIWLSTHGKFDKTTRIAVVEFQKSRKPPLPSTGVVGKGTWAALDQVAGPVKVGRAEYDWSQRAEGTITGSKTAYTWRLLQDRLQVTVNIKFTGASKHPMVDRWRKDITDIWNAFKFVDPGKPGKDLLLDFVVGSGTPADAVVKVHKTPKDATEIPRSDSANFHTGDTRKGLAPHEFGHLIGLQDEYNKAPEVYTAATGEQPLFGELDAPTNKKGDAIDPAVIAGLIRHAVEGNPATRGKRAKAVVQKFGLKQGGFAQRVAMAYEKANAGKLLREDFKDGVGYVVVKDPAGSMGNDLAARIPGRMNTAPDEADVLEPFLYSNRGIMGTMEEVENPSGIDPHDHPVAERHVRGFLKILVANRPGNWKVVKR
jgi:peptidoglycan hydrolase-like protein with peptidoglycan-binding domain